MFSGREFAAKLLSRVARIPAVTEQNFLEIVQPPNTFSPPKPKTRALNKMYSDRPQVRAIVSKVSKAVAEHGWYFEDKDGERVDKHPALDFLRRGNPQLRGRQAIQTTVAHVDLTGESFWIIGRKGNKPTMYAPIPADWVRNVPDGDNGTFEIHIPNGKQFDLPASEVIWFKDVDPLDPYARGTSLLGSAAIELSADENAANYLNAQFGNRMRPDLIVTGTEKAALNEKDKARLEMTWFDKFRGSKKAGKPFFSSQPLNVQELGKGFRDNQMVEVSQMFRDTIYETFGVPPEIFGRLESSNKATIDSADYLFARHTVDPRLSFLLDHIEPFLQENFPGVEALTLRYESPIAEDGEFALKVMQARAGAFTDNEARKLAKHKPMPGLDDLPEPEPAPGDEDPSNEPPKNKKKPKPDEDKAAKPTVDKSLSPEEIVRVSAAHEDPAVMIEATAIVDSIFRKLLDEYGADLLGELEAEANFELNGVIDNWIRVEAPQLMQQVNATTRKELVAALTEGVAANEAMQALNDRIDEIFKQAAETRAVMIGQTLATKLTGFGSLEAARQAGFTQKKWLSSVDQVVRSSHSALNNQVKLLAEKFQSPRGGQAMHPGAFGEAAEDANCRCAMRPILDGEDTGKAAKAMSDDAFTKFQRAAFDKMSGQLRATLKNVFLAQKAVAQHQFRVIRVAS